MSLRPLLAVLLLLAGHAVAQERPTLVVPPGGQLRQVEAGGPPTFTGTTTIHAILIAQWVPDAQGDGLPGPTFHLLPVPQSAAQIPHLAGAPMRFLSITDGERILARATHEDIAAEFAARKLGVVHVEGLFTITDLRVGTPCATAGQARILEADPIRVRFPFQAAPLACPS